MQKSFSARDRTGTRKKRWLLVISIRLAAGRINQLLRQQVDALLRRCSLVSDGRVVGFHAKKALNVLQTAGDAQGSGFWRSQATSKDERLGKLPISGAALRFSLLRKLPFVFRAVSIELVVCAVVSSPVADHLQKNQRDCETISP